MIIEYEGIPEKINNGYIIKPIKTRSGKIIISKSKKPSVISYANQMRHLARSKSYHFKNFDPYSHYLEMQMYWYSKKFYTKDKRLNAKSGDIDGIVKFAKDATLPTCCSEIF